MLEPNTTVVVDTSALIALLFEEQEADAISQCLDQAAARLISAANVLEFGTVLAGRNHIKPTEIATDTRSILMHGEIDIAPVTSGLIDIALESRIRFGKGFGSSAKLNFGDCFAYALAKHHDAPLLFIGNDFAQTDVKRALAA